jgi:hypothetical protein
MTSPTCTVNATATTNGVDVTAGSTAGIALADVANVTQWALTCIGTDDSTLASTINGLLTVDQVTKTASLTPVPAAGTAMVFQSQVNNGRDVNGRAVPEYTTTFAIFVPLTGGYRTGAINETLEGSAAFGWITKLNALTRAVASSTASVDAKASVRIATTADHGLTGLAAIDGITPVVGDRVLVRTNAAPAQNGVYVAGSGAWARATDFNESAEVTTGATFYVEEGTAWGGTTWQLSTTGAITVGSTSVQFKLVGATAATNNPARSGDFRAAKALSFKMRKSDDANDVNVLAGDGLDSLYIGDSTHMVGQVSQVASGGSYTWQVAGAAILSLNATTLSWDKAIASPTVTQTTRTGTGANAGAALTIQSQAGQQQTGGAANNNGGKVLLAAGAAGTGGSGAAGVNGTVELKCGANTIGRFKYDADPRFQLDAAASYFLFEANGASQGIYFQAVGASGSVNFQTGTVNFHDATPATTLTAILNSTGTTTLQATTGVTAFTINQADKTTNSGTGAALTIQAQNETGTTSTGGALNLKSGTGTTAAGAVVVSAGAAERLRLNATGFAFNGATPIARPDYTVTNHTDARSINETGATLVQVANTLGTLINDLILYGILQ